MRRTSCSLKHEYRIPESGVNKYTCLSDACQKVYQGEWVWDGKLPEVNTSPLMDHKVPRGQRQVKLLNCWRKRISVCERKSECTTYSLSVSKPCSLYSSSCFIQARSSFSLFTWDAQTGEENKSYSYQNQHCWSNKSLPRNTVFS